MNSMSILKTNADWKQMLIGNKDLYINTNVNDIHFSHNLYGIK